MDTWPPPLTLKENRWFGPFLTTQNFIIGHDWPQGLKGPQRAITIWMCKWKETKKGEIPLHFKESYAIPDWVSLFCHFPLLSLTIWPVVSFCLRRFGSSGSSHFACYELSVLLLFFPLLSQSLPPNLFFLNMTLLFCEVPTSFSLCFTASPLRWGAVWRSLMSSKGCRLTPADSLSSSAHGSCLPLFYSLRPSSGSST